MSKIQVDVISDADDKGLSAVDKSLRDLGKSAQQVAKETEKGAHLATGSYAKLRGELASNKKALEQLEVGSDAFKEQANVVAELEDKVGAAKKSISQLTKAGKHVKGLSAQATVAANSVEGITSRLRQANQELNRTERGSDAYKKQAVEVKKLQKELDEATDELKDFTGQRRGVEGVTGSLSRLESELEDNVRQLRNLKVGTDEFKKQKLVVDKLARSVDKAKKENKALGESGDKSLKTIDHSAGNAGKAIKGAGVVATALAVALERAGAASREIIVDAADEAVDVDTLARRLQIQGGLTDDERLQVGSEVLSDARDQGVRKEVAFGVAEQTISSGFDKPIENDITDLFIKAIGATNFEGDGRDLVKATSQFLKASEKELTKENTESLLADVHSLFKGTDLQATDLSDFANAAPVLTGAGFEQKELLATLTALREVMTPEKAATAGRNFVVNLESADAKKSSREALESIGVSPQDVDFTGEGLPDVLKTLSEGLATVAPEKQNIALVKLFGKENLAASQALLRSANKISDYIAIQGNTQQFYQDAITAADSKQSVRNRIEITKSIEVFERASGDKAFESDVARKRSDADYRRQRQDASVEDSLGGLLRGAKLHVDQSVRNRLVDMKLLDERDISKDARVRDIDVEIERLEADRAANIGRPGGGYQSKQATRDHEELKLLRAERQAIVERNARKKNLSLPQVTKAADESAKPSIVSSAHPVPTQATVPQPQGDAHALQMLMESRKRTKLVEEQSHATRRQTQLLEATLWEARKGKTLNVKNVDAGPVERPSVSSEVP